MSDNPFQAPESDLQPVVGVLSGLREDVRKVAKYQRAIMFCILMNIGALICQIAMPQELKFLPAIAFLIFGIANTVFVFLLATKVYGTVIGIFLGLFAIFPCIGLLVLLAVNAKATKILTQNGIKVGFLGANPADI